MSLKWVWVMGILVVVDVGVMFDVGVGVLDSEVGSGFGLFKVFDRVGFGLLLGVGDGRIV